MKNKILIGAIAALVIAGGTVAIASKSGTQPDDSIHQEDKISANMSQQNYKVENPSVNNGQTKALGHITSEQAADIAVKTVNGTVSEIEKELEHGRWQYKVELHTNSGEAEIRIDAETGEVVRLDDDSKSDDGANQNRHNGNDDRDIYDDKYDDDKYDDDKYDDDKYDDN